jgi:DNA polymerase-3 subunit alpha
VFVDGEPGIASVRSLLARMAEGAPPAARGPIHLCLLAPDLPGEVELILGDDFPVSPQIKGALRAMEGVLTVEEV